MAESLPPTHPCELYLDFNCELPNCNSTGLLDLHYKTYNDRVRVVCQSPEGTGIGVARSLDLEILEVKILQIKNLDVERFAGPQSLDRRLLIPFSNRLLRPNNALTSTNASDAKDYPIYSPIDSNHASDQHVWDCAIPIPNDSGNHCRRQKRPAPKGRSKIRATVLAVRDAIGQALERGFGGFGSEHLPRERETVARLA